MAMALIKRNNNKATEGNGGSLMSSSSSPPPRLLDPKRSSCNGRTATSVLTQALVVVGIYVLCSRNSSMAGGPQQTRAKASAISKLLQNNDNNTTFDIDTNVVLVLDIPTTSENVSSLGPYRATLLAKKSACPNLGFWLRLEGDALDTVLLTEQGDQWEGTFWFPMAGQYELVAYWKGCNNEDAVQKIPLTKVNAKGELSVSTPEVSGFSSTLYPRSAWISSKKFKNVPKTTPYVWHSPSVPISDATLITTKNSTVSKEGAAFEATGFYAFRGLSNYELVCWVGSQSATDSRNVFLDERRTIASGQRPFKFHIYSSDNFVHPAEEWPENEAARFRKCKHVLVSMDQVKTSLTQQEYANQVTIFINHLLKAFPDDTFPIWMFTVNESAMTPTNCLSPFFLPRTSEHPCDTVLKHLFDISNFPERVRLLDNTAISLPQLGENIEDVKAAIALRIFVFVGKQVQIWRESGQEGRIDGLHRGGTVEPNFELVPYPDWL